MAWPVMPEDEGLGYLVTQAIGDYLASQSRLDGTIFPSVQMGTNASNIVLFHHGARVEQIQLPEDAELQVNAPWNVEDDSENDYYVWLEVPAERPKDKEEPREATPVDLLLLPLILSGHDPDPRQPSLRIDAESIEVHRVKAATYSVSTRKVRRHSSVKGKVRDF
jgi:hypothetical protein